MTGAGIKAAGLPSGAAPPWLMWWHVPNRTGAWRQPLRRWGGRKLELGNVAFRSISYLFEISQRFCQNKAGLGLPETFSRTRCKTAGSAPGCQSTASVTRAPDFYDPQRPCRKPATIFARNDCLSVRTERHCGGMVEGRGPSLDSAPPAVSPVRGFGGDGARRRRYGVGETAVTYY